MVSALRVLILGLLVVAFAAPVCAQTSSALPFIGLTPCRIADTRSSAGPNGAPALAGGTPRDFILSGQCGIPGSAEAVSLNITVTNTLGPGFILIFPQGAAAPLVSTVNYVAGQTVANAAVVPLNFGGVTVIAGVSGTDLIIDTNGYYGSPAANASNVFLGPGAGNTTMSGVFNTAIGAQALFGNTTGNSNTAIGDGALVSNTTGGGNTASGTLALVSNTTGFNNTASGNTALGRNTTGSGNIAIGFDAGPNITAGNGNIILGNSAGSNISTGSNNIYIGNAGFNDESNQIRIGDSAVQNGAVIAGISGATSVGGIPVLINPGGRLGVTTSSRRFKEEIRDMGEVSDGLMRLRPVKFRYKASLDPSGSPQYGLIAEEVAEVFPDLVVYDKGGEPETVRYHVLVPMLLNEVQKDRKTIAEDRKAIADLTARLERLEALMSEPIR